MKGVGGGGLVAKIARADGQTEPELREGWCK